MTRQIHLIFSVALSIVVLVAVFVLQQLVPPQELQWLHHSRLMPHLDVLAQWAQTLFSQFDAGQLSGHST